MSEQSIFDFGDLRSFLWSHVRQQKDQKPTFTLGQWAKRMGFASTSTLTKVLNGERELGPQAQKKMLQYFKLPKAEAEQFSMLVALSKGRMRLGPGRLSQAVVTRYKTVSLEEFRSIADVDAFVLRETLRLAPSLSVSELIQKQRRPKNRRDTEVLLQSLKTLGLVNEIKPGLFAYANGHVNSSSDLANEAIRQYHEQSLMRIKDDVRGVDTSQRELQSTTFCIDANDLERAKNKIRKFRQEFAREFESSHGDIVYQLHLSFVPQTKLSPKNLKKEAVK